MKKKKKKVAMVTRDYVANCGLTEQLNDIFGNEVQIISILIDDYAEIDAGELDLIVCSNEIILEETKQKISNEIPIISVRRGISLNKIAEVISLDIGVKVLVVNTHLYAANETIDLLKRLGIEHIDFIPYYPGCNNEIEDIAVTPGGTHLVPMGVKKVIDIGVRTIEISSVIEIFLKLNLPTEHFPIISERYSKEIIQLTKYNSEINKMLKALFEVTNDGIAALDISGNIFFCNQKFAFFLGYKHCELISKNITEVIKEKHILDIILDSHHRNNEIIETKNKQLMLNKTLLYKGSILQGHVLGLQEVLHIQNLEKEVRKKLVSKGFVAKYNFSDLIGVSPILINKINVAKKIAKSDLTVLIQGEDGTGKEIFAQAIHNASMRRNEPFVAVNFAAISETLLESELFGYEEGSFTGATKGGKAGLFEQADKGTIFIDEIGDTSPRIQMRLLRVLQEKQIMRVGGSKIIPIDVRVIAATNKNLLGLVEKQKFRKDLYYRLKVLYFDLPTLKERKEDIPLLAKYFLNYLDSSKYLSEEVIEMFKNYSWPGNIRELENLIYYIDNIVENTCVKIKDLPEDFIDKADGNSRENNKDSNRLDIYLLPVDKIDEYIAILTILDHGNRLGFKMGRDKISSILRSNNINLSSEQVRYRLRDMGKIEFVVVGNTKQGTILSKKGKEFLELHEKNRRGGN